MSAIEVKIKRAAGGVMLVHWVPLLATALVLHNCYIPGRSGYARFGMFLWFCVGVAWIIRRIRKRPSWAKRPAWPFLILLCVSAFACSPIPCAIGLKCSLSAFEQLARKVKKENLRFNRYFLDQNMPVRATLGFYPIYDYGVKADGGIYFITSACGIIDTEVDGFAFKPSTDYWYEFKTFHVENQLFGDWYTFWHHEKW